MAEEKKETAKTPEELAAEKKQTEKAATLVVIGMRPDDFKWRLQGTVFDKAALLKEVGEESATGELIVKLVQEIVGEPAGEGSFQLGKRAVCLLCGTELLITKAGDGVMTCCGQNMEIKAPKPIPSSD